MFALAKYRREGEWITYHTKVDGAVCTREKRIAAWQRRSRKAYLGGKLTDTITER
jgi:hypothetical protein